METIVYIDGRNFIGKLESIFKVENRPVPMWHNYDFKSLFNKVLGGIPVNSMVFYFSRIKQHPDTKEKSQALIQAQRLLKTHLEHQNFIVILAGVVRGNVIKDSTGKEALVFKEKGVDVSIAVDAVVAACDGKIKSAIIASSDSDLQPAIRELNKRNVESIYLGFKLMPNKGLTATTKRTILIKDADVMNFINSV